MLRHLLKKSFLLLIIVTILQGVILVTSAADLPNISVADVSCNAGDIIEIPVVLSNCNGFSDISVEIGYNTSVMQLTSVTNKQTSGTFSKSRTLATEPYMLSWYSDSNVVYNGTMAILKFVVSDSAVDGKYDITIGYYKGANGTYVDGQNVNFDEDWNALGLSYSNACVTVGTGIPPVIITEPFIKVVNTSATIGNTVCVEIAMGNCQGFANLAIEIEYNTEALELKSATNSITSGSFTKSQSLNSYPYVLSWNNTDNIVYSGTIATLEFNVLNAAIIGDNPIGIDFYKGRNSNYVDGINVNYDADYNSLGLSYIDGYITVSSTKPELRVTNLVKSGGITADLKLTSPSTAVDGTVIVALYKGNKLSEIKQYSASPTIPISFERIGENTDMKVMWWANTNTIRPIADSQNISL